MIKYMYNIYIYYQNQLELESSRIICTLLEPFQTY